MTRTMLAIAMTGVAAFAVAETETGNDGEAAAAVEEQAAADASGEADQDADEDAVPDETWRGSAELAYSVKRGNTNSDRFRFRNDAEKETENWRHTSHLEAVGERSRPTPDEPYQRTAERYTGSYKVDRKFGEANYVFNQVSAERDHFSGFDYEASYALGYGRRLVSTPRQQLDTEIGPGYRWRRFEEGRQPAGEGREDDDPVVQVGVLYNLRVTETSTFREDIRAQYESDSTVARAATTFTTMVNDRISVRINHIIRYNSERPSGVDSTDNELSVGMVVRY